MRLFNSWFMMSFVFLFLSTRLYAQFEWSFSSPRAEIAPAQWIEKEIIFAGRETLALSGDSKEYVHGWWGRSIAVKPETSYEFAARFLARNVEEPHRCILARLIWLNAKGERIDQAEYPRTLDDPQEWRVIRQIYKSPPSASR